MDLVSLDDNELESMGAECSRRVRRDFDTSFMARKYVALIDESLDASRKITSPIRTLPVRQTKVSFESYNEALRIATANLADVPF